MLLLYYNVFFITGRVRGVPRALREHRAGALRPDALPTTLREHQQQQPPAEEGIHRGDVHLHVQERGGAGGCLR